MTNFRFIFVLKTISLHPWQIIIFLLHYTLMLVKFYQDLWYHNKQFADKTCFNIQVILSGKLSASYKAIENVKCLE